MSTETVHPFLTWAPPGQPLVIQFDHSAMDRLNIEVMRGFGVTRRRGTETGGVLLGKIDRRAKSPLIHIQDFEVVACEYASGPSYVLSPGDLHRFKEAVARWQPSLDRDQYAVGYFRSHTREGFALDERDATVFREFFPDPLDIALLVKPFATRPAIAGFFLKEKGTLVTTNTPLEFKFETPVRGTDPDPSPTDTAPAPAPVPAKPVTVSPPRKTTAPAARRQVDVEEPATAERALFTAQAQWESPWLRPVLWTAFFVALLAFGAACGFEYAGRQWQRQNSPTGVMSERGGLPNSTLYAIGLQSIKAGNSVIVKWDRDAAPIQAALHGVLTVSEGGNSKQVKLGFAELRNGSVMYPLTAPAIGFRLEIFFKDNRSFVESTTYSAAAQ